MKLTANKMFSALLTLSIVAGTGQAAFARDSWDIDRLVRQPIVKQAAIGAAAGVAGGVLSDRMSVTKGALTGAVVGAGTGALSQSRYMQQRPLIRRTLQGAVVGTGVGVATDNSKLKSALIGAGAGAGYHYVRKYMDR